MKTIELSYNLILFRLIYKQYIYKIHFINKLIFTYIYYFYKYYN